MHIYKNFSTGIWMYFVLHGSYGILWLMKDMIFPDKTFQRNANIFGAILSWAMVLGPYWIGGFIMASRNSWQEPPIGRIVLVCWVYIIGAFLMLGSDG